MKLTSAVIALSLEMVMNIWMYHYTDDSGACHPRAGVQTVAGETDPGHRAVSTILVEETGKAARVAELSHISNLQSESP